MLIKTIVSVNQLSSYRAVLTWCLERRNEGYNVSANTNLNISQEQVTTLAQHETVRCCAIWRREIDLFPYAKKISVTFKNMGQVSRDAGFSKLAGVGQYFVPRPVT